MIRTTTAAWAVGTMLTLAACSSHSSSAAPSSSGTTSAPAATTAPSASAGAPSASVVPSVTPPASVAATSAALATSAASAAATSATIPATVTSPGSTPTATPTTTAGAVTPVAGTRCLNAQLTVSLGASSPGAGQIYTSLVFTNTGATSCTLVGHPGVSYVAGDDGHQVGTSASRDSGAITTVTLAPGGVASATMHEVNYENFDQGVCKPVETRGLRVYPPGSKAAFFVPRAGKQCSAKVLPDPALSIGVVKAGAGS